MKFLERSLEKINDVRNIKKTSELIETTRNTQTLNAPSCISTFPKENKKSEYITNVFCYFPKNIYLWLKGKLQSSPHGFDSSYFDVSSNE